MNSDKAVATLSMAISLLSHSITPAILMLDEISSDSLDQVYLPVLVVSLCTL